jgi:hypothetical protein
MLMLIMMMMLMRRGEAGWSTERGKRARERAG